MLFVYTKVPQYDESSDLDRPFLACIIIEFIYGFLTSLRTITIFSNLEEWIGFNLQVVLGVLRLVSMILCAVFFSIENGNQLIFGFWLVT